MIQSPFHLLQGGTLVEDVFRLVLAQVRAKRETAGDFRAQIAANLTGARRLQAIVQQHGAETVRACMQELLAYTERRTRTELQRLPRGTYRADGVIDSDGFTDKPVRLAGAITIDDYGVCFDLSGCDQQRSAPVNATSSQTFSACAYVLKCLIDPDIPVNAGFDRHVRMIAPEGTVVHARHPVPVVGGWEVNSRLTDVLLAALAPALPDLIPAGTKGMICHAGFGGAEPRRGEYYCFLETLFGGYGVRGGSDGPDAVQAHVQNTENAPVEETEGNYHVRIIRYELVNDSEGAGT